MQKSYKMNEFWRILYQTLFQNWIGLSWISLIFSNSESSLVQNAANFLKPTLSSASSYFQSRPTVFSQKILFLVNFVSLCRAY